MIVEFKTVRSSIEEKFERDKQEEMNGKYSLPFLNEYDYIASIFIELNNVIDFEEGQVYVNDKLHICVYVRVDDDTYTRNVLIEPGKFKSILEYSRNEKIKTATEILNIISNENNPTSI